MVRHTGPLRLYPTFQQWKQQNHHHDIALSSVRLLSLAELENPGECKRTIGNVTYCTQQPHCIHQHTVSPAELNGQDDNADLQIRQYEERLAAAAALQSQRVNYTKVPRACQRLNDFIQQTTKRKKQAVVFVQPTKTGGTSIEHALGFQRSCHATASDFMECNANDYKKSLTFVTLRNPVERTVSLYNYVRNGGNGGAKDATKFAWVQGLDFASFVQALANQTQVNFAPQTHFIINPNSNTSELLLSRYYVQNVCRKIGSNYKTSIRLLLSLDPCRPNDFVCLPPTTASQQAKWMQNLSDDCKSSIMTTLCSGRNAAVRRSQTTSKLWRHDLSEYRGRPTPRAMETPSFAQYAKASV